MNDQQRPNTSVRPFAFVAVLLGTLCITLASCGFPSSQPRRTDTDLSPGAPQPNRRFRQVSLSPIYAEMPSIPDAEYVNDDEFCLQCHKAYTESFQHNVHRGIHQGQSCEACHGPGSRHIETRGKVPGLMFNFKTMPPAQAAEVCLKCHEQNACSPGAQWRTSKHAHSNMSCNSCHTSHYNLPPGTPPTTEPGAEARNAQGAVISLASFRQPIDTETLRSRSNNLNAMAPDTCYRCHGDMADLQHIAGPHQICGPNGMNCTTCHDAHGNLLEYSRQQLCMDCHKADSPTMAWHSSTHALMGVACTDCHNPHPRGGVDRFINTSGVDLTHTHLSQTKRRPMSVQEPEVCYKCHPKIFAESHLPSHHPIREGKMVCSDCHDGHGQLEGSLNADSKNLLCWKCHADKQGPFAYEHPPVTEDCGICHASHGSVTDNLLKQPPTFLCLRCHVGHRDGNHGGGDRVDIDTIPQVRPGFYTNCMTCHSQIHGSDLPSPHFPGMFR